MDVKKATTIAQQQQKGQESILRKSAQFDSKEQIPFEIKGFQSACRKAGLFYTDKLIARFVSSLLTKPFIILTGLSGSGKTKLAQAYVQWISQEDKQYCIVPVGADWTNREPLLGYPNALKSTEYVKPDSGVIDLIMHANANPKLPHFLVLDEMNLSLVERYFADFLSVMESGEQIHLYAEGTAQNGVPAKLKLPKNLFIIGTVNIDETTNMFSPKVLDRANTIEFRINQQEMDSFLTSTIELDMQAMYLDGHEVGAGANMARHFMEHSENKSLANKDRKKIDKEISKFFSELQKTGAEFGYRTATDILVLINQLGVLDKTMKTSEKIDIAIMQKLLPKLHGSRRKLSPVLETLGGLCVKKPTVIGMSSNGIRHLKVVKDVFDKDVFDYTNLNVLYPLTLEKIARMYKGAKDSGFASFAEA
jgi:5-methylcytosine-specific restriction protein B